MSSRASIASLYGISGSGLARAKTIGLSVVEHATYFGRIKPDLLLIVGDRYDMLAPVISAATMNIPIAHIQGGETSGTIDNIIRDVLTKFSTLHFVSTDKSANNLIKHGVNKNNVFNFGCPAVEYISKVEIGEYFIEASSDSGAQTYDTETSYLLRGEKVEEYE